MKHFFILLLLAATTLAFGAEKIETTYAGATLGKTTWRELRDYYAGNAEYFSSSIVADSTLFALNGDFEIDGLHFHTMKASFVQDTLYDLKFFASDLNGEEQQKYTDFLRKEAVKYAQFENLIDSTYNQTSKDSVWRRDSTTGIFIVNKHNEVTFSVWNTRLSFLHLNYQINEFNKLYSSIFDNVNTDPKNKVTGIARVNFGDTKVSVENKFYNKWQKIVVDEHSSMYTDVKVGGQLYNTFVLYYKYDETKKTQVLISANLQKRFRTWQDKEAKEFFNIVCDVYKSKYSNFFVVKDEDDYKFSACGMYTQEYRNGEMPPIFITLEKSLSQGGDWYYYVVVKYFGLNIENLYDDEI